MIRSSLVLMFALSALALLAPAAGGDEIDDQIAVVKAVGPRGAGNVAASEAWNQLAQLEADQLPRLLAALDDAEPLPANWLRAAVDSIAERGLKSSAGLPLAQLESFALDTDHSPRARRLAYEWLVRGDAGAEGRLIPQMLHDPSLEFRRDAVARLTAEADKLLAAEQNDAARSTYEQALAAARDLDQVQAIAAELKKLDVEVDLPRHFGFITRWKIIGPFDNTDMQGFDVAYAPEGAIDLDAEHPGKSDALRWFDHATDHELGEVDLKTAITEEQGVVAYALAEFHSDERRPVDIRLSSVNANKVWLNGELLTANEVYHTLADMDQYIAQGELQPGKNVILLKICQNEQPESWAKVWKFQARVCDDLGAAVLSTDRDSAPAAAPAAETTDESAN